MTVAAVMPRMFSYELPVPAGGRLGPSAAGTAASASLPEGLLVRNVLWFCRLRWAVVAIFVVFGTLGQFPELLPGIGLRPHREWPFAAALVLTLANLGFLAHGRRLARSALSHGATADLWVQIAVDLVVLTVVVHYVGSLETYVAFAYLFHIVLASIFFPRSQSFAITAIACGLYVACVALEEAHVVGLAGIYTDTALRDQMDHMPGARLLNVGWAIVTWGVVSYLTSHLSAMVRERDGELAETNRLLLEAQEEKTQHMLHTTHELKAPFSAIHANAQLLLKGHCGALPDEAHDVLRRIATRSQRLAAEIQQMLQLANLRSKVETPPRVEVDLAEVLDWCIAQARARAAEREIAIEQGLRPARVLAVEDHMKMLLANLLSNALTYSHQGGRVRVECTPGAGNGPQVVIEDHGIGIPRDKLSHIFDAYYRTNEAVRHNRESTGLGLAIVKHVAEAHAIRVRVESAPDVGTTFTLQFPPARRSRGLDGGRKEVENGLSADRGRRRGLRDRHGEGAD